MNTLQVVASSVKDSLGQSEDMDCGTNEAWSYDEAFCRNRGLITPQEQIKLRNSRVAIAGMGGVGGIDLVTLARLGIGNFTIADPDYFAVANTNRQYGAATSTCGRSKVDVMAGIVKEINPLASVRVIRAPIDEYNVAEFLADASVFVDAVDFFRVDNRRKLFQAAAENGIHAITGGPVGFSAVWITFDPKGLSFDKYFDLRDSMTHAEKVIAFGVGVAPTATQRNYLALDSVDIKSHTGPSSSIACNIAGGAIACDVAKILLGRGRVWSAPYYNQFDPFVGRFVRKRLRGGNRNPLQLLKRWYLARRFQ